MLNVLVVSATSSYFTSTSLKTERNTSNKLHNRLRIPNHQEADQLAIYNVTQPFNEALPRNNSSLTVRAGLKSVTSGFQVQRPTHSATLPPYPLMVVAISHDVPDKKRVSPWLHKMFQQ